MSCCFVKACSILTQEKFSRESYHSSRFLLRDDTFLSHLYKAKVDITNYFSHAFRLLEHYGTKRTSASFNAQHFSEDIKSKDSLSCQELITVLVSCHVSHMSTIQLIN